VIRAAIKFWIPNLKTYLLSAFFQSLEEITYSLVGFKAAGADRVTGKKKKDDRMRRPGTHLLSFILLTAVTSNPRQINCLE